MILVWTDSTDDTKQYVLERDDGPGFEEIALLPRGTSEYLDQGLENGKTYFYRISARDSSGNQGPESVPLIGLARDLTPPRPPVVSPLPELTNESKHLLHGTAEPNASVVVVVDGEEALTIPVGADGTFEGTLTLSDGINRVRYRTIDPALNPSGQTPEVIVQVDLNPPRVTSSQPYPGQTGVLVTETVLVVVSEALIADSVDARLVYGETGVEVPSSFQYAAISKTITLYSSTEMEKDTEYKVVVDGMDAAGNHLEGGSFVFTTEHKEVKDANISSSLVIVLIVLVMSIIGVVLFQRYWKRMGPGLGEGSVGRNEGAESESEPEARGENDGWSEY